MVAPDVFQTVFVEGTIGAADAKEVYCAIVLRFLDGEGQRWWESGFGRV